MAKQSQFNNTYGTGRESDPTVNRVTGKVISAVLKRGHVAPEDVDGDAAASQHSHLGSGMTSAKSNRGESDGVTTHHPTMGRTKR